MRPDSAKLGQSLSTLARMRPESTKMGAVLVEVGQIGLKFRGD